MVFGVLGLACFGFGSRSPFSRVGSGSRVGPGFWGLSPHLIAAVFPDRQFLGEVRLPGLLGCLVGFSIKSLLVWSFGRFAYTVCFTTLLEKLDLISPLTAPLP